VIVGVEEAVLVKVGVAATIPIVAPVKGRLLKRIGCPFVPVPPVRLKL